MSEHDPLCPMTKPCVDKHSGRIETHAMCECHVICMHCEVATCQCSVLKQARADEREQIIERLDTVVIFLHERHCEFLDDGRCNCKIGRAVRGEQS